MPGVRTIRKRGRAAETSGISGVEDSISHTASLMFLMGIVLCCLLSDYIAASIVSLMILVLWLIVAFYRNPWFLYKYLALIYAASLNVVGCAVCEFTNTYLTELGIVSYYAGSLPLLVLGRWVFLATLFYWDRRKRRDYDTPKGDSQGLESALTLFLCALFAIMCLFSFMHVFPRPAFLMGTSRFNYSAEYITGIWASFNSWLAFLVVVPALLTKSKRFRPFAISCIVAYALFLFWTGTKFGAFFNVATVLIIVHFDSLRGYTRSAVRKATLLVVAALIGLAFFAGFVNQFVDSSSTVSEYLFQRQAQQGQLWWKTYDELSGECYPEQILNEIAGVTAPVSVRENANSNYGIYHIMKYVAPASTVNGYLNSNVRFTEAGYATANYCLGPLGVILFGFLVGILFAEITNLGIRVLAHGRSFLCVLWMWLYLMARTAVSMFTFNVFFTNTGYIVIALCVADSIMHKWRDRSAKGNLRINDDITKGEQISNA